MLYSRNISNVTFQLIAEKIIAEILQLQYFKKIVSETLQL